jgi:hypothetical protein
MLFRLAPPKHLLQRRLFRKALTQLQQLLRNSTQRGNSLAPAQWRKPLYTLLLTPLLW